MAHYWGEQRGFYQITSLNCYTFCSARKSSSCSIPVLWAPQTNWNLPTLSWGAFILLSHVLCCLPHELQMVILIWKHKCNKFSRLVFGWDWGLRLFNQLLWKTHQPTSSLTREQWFHSLTNKAFVLSSLLCDSGLYCAFVSKAKWRIHNLWQLKYFNLDFPVTQLTY